MNSHRFYSTTNTAMMRVLLTLALVLPALWVSTAQIQMSISSPQLDEYPIVKIPVQLRDNSSVISSLSLSYFTIEENANNRVPMYLDCATDTLWQSLSFLFVLDVSLSMKYQFGTKVDDPQLRKWNSALEAFNVAIDALRPNDGGTLYSFARYSEMVVPFTTDKDALRAGLTTLNFQAGTSIYDTIIKVLQDATNIGGRRVMILLTDGSDLHSWSSEYDAIALAQQMGIPIYIIGLDVDPKDNDVLRLISEGTGGEYNYAPTAEELQVVMFNIAENIQTKDCILAYRTDDTCRDGVVRNINVRATIGPDMVNAATEYSLPYDPIFIDLRIGETGLQVEDDTPVSLPLTVTGPLRKDRYLKVYTEIVYDPDVVEFEGIDSTVGIASLTNASIYPHPSRSDAMVFACNRISLHEDVAANEEKALFAFQFKALHQDSTISSQVIMENVSTSQHCPITPTAYYIPFTILGCRPMAVSLDTSVVAFGGDEFIVPLKLGAAAGDLGSPFEFLFTLRYDPEHIAFNRALTAGTLSEHMTVNITEPQPGLLRIIGLPGIPETQYSDIIRLVFDATRVPDVQKVAMYVENANIVHSCTPTVTMSGSSVLLDGECSKLVRRKSFFLDQNAPNPVSKSATGLTEITYTATEDVPVLLQVFDTEGRPVRTLVNGVVSTGKHTVRFSPGELPAGVYFYTMTQGDNMWTRKMVIRE